MKDVRVRRGRKFTLAIPHLSIEAGLAVITGPNGAGKTTLLECIAGSHARKVGALSVSGSNPARWSQRDAANRAMGFAPQALALPRRWSVREYLQLGLWLKGRTRQDVSEMASKAAAAVEVELDAIIGKLSGGMQRRVLIAQALASRPSVLLLDEPLAGLDKHSQQLIVGIVEAYDKGGAVIATDHTGTLENLQHQDVRLLSGRLV